MKIFFTCGCEGRRWRRVGRAIGAAVRFSLLPATLPAQSVSQTRAHFSQVPQLTGTPEQCNRIITSWLLGGVSNVVDELDVVVSDRNLSDATVRQFRQRLHDDQDLGAPVESAITNTETRVKALDDLLQSPNMNSEVRRLTEENKKFVEDQLNALRLNRQKVEIVRKKLGELDKETCERWEIFWRNTAPAMGIDETRGQLRMLIRMEKEKFLQWVKSEKGLNG